ncbi:MAG: branched-chain amino acid ABC transporter permease [Desulfurococcales archaeon]|nr:branched-chain amino acid ABC transporter permease [Desulfurococcales archaeon]
MIKGKIIDHTSLIIMIFSYIIIWMLKTSFPEYSQMLTLLLYYIAIAQAYNIFLGMTGYVDFGYVSYFGLGLYGMALGVSYASQNNLSSSEAIILGMILSVILAGSVAGVVGGIALRLRGAFFAIATIGLSQALRYLIEGAKIWGGAEGIIIAKDLRKLFGEEGFSYATIILPDTGIFILAVATGIIMYLIRISRLGYGLLAIKEDEDAAKVFGVNTTLYKFVAFIISAVLTSLVGSMWTLKVTAIYPPESFNITFSVEFIVIVMLGGGGTVLGPLIGASIYSLSKYYLGVYLPGLQLTVFSIILLLIVLLFRQGIVGELRSFLYKHEIVRKIIR